VLHRHRHARLEERAHTRFEFLVGQGRAGALVQVVGPRRDDEALDIARRLGEVAVEAPERRAVAAPRARSRLAASRNGAVSSVRMR
jgi:hypothetical protein